MFRLNRAGSNNSLVYLIQIWLIGSLINYGHKYFYTQDKLASDNFFQLDFEFIQMSLYSHVDWRSETIKCDMQK